MGFFFSLRLYSAENRLKVNSCIYKWDGIGEKPLDLRIIVWHSGKEPTWWCRRLKRLRFDPWVGKIPWRRKRQLTPVCLPGESHGQRSLAGYSPWVCKELDTTEAHGAQSPTEKQPHKGGKDLQISNENCRLGSTGLLWRSPVHSGSASGFKHLNHKDN